MPKLDYKNIKNINDINSYDVFVETGSYKGETIFHMEKYFNELHTIEIKKEFYDDLTKKYNGNKIKFYLGDSSKVLNQVIETINKPTIFFLDGHWSSGNTGKGKVHVPLYDELTIINNFIHKCIIIIDDFRLFETNNICDWSNIKKEKVMSILKDRIEKIYHIPSPLHKEDRFVIHLKPK